MSQFISIDMIKTLPINSMNRDNTGKAKQFTMGGVQRNYISSQAIKRAQREYGIRKWNEYGGKRSKFHFDAIKQAFINNGVADVTDEMVKELHSKFSDIDDAKEGKVLIFFSQGEWNLIVKSFLEDPKKIAMPKLPNDAVDVALYGRMVASDHTYRVDGATATAMAYTTHRTNSDFDFFTAVDDIKHDSDGSSHLGDSNFTNGVYYFHQNLNIDKLKENLENNDEDFIKEVVEHWMESMIKTSPSGKQASMYAHTLPKYVQVTISEDQPVVSGAFETEAKTSESAIEVFIKEFEETKDFRDIIFTTSTKENKLNEIVAETIKNIK